ncbi:MAG: 30S ribosomal protein S9 [Bacteroidales bacterium]|jgi:small subunit ribosomal protein S9|nr:30S ribosomal protein S9 [Bacteroidales bacterium]MDD2204704.1 30S ribosomal protein S9 [Bacteroidales bacterium]MDD3151943.1 30S ribosomal protein S9 [Bacteroidales bacterium]MDD3914067.1 30S ribosomal protein S9 [Bacteroidales bacterium]MDD4634031.1 30S ribosomal protein S9 [Bacteroidales bacterium]
MEVINTIGRRKAAIARIYMKEGNGRILINKRELEDYFPLSTLRYIVNQPFETTQTAGMYDVNINLVGGGFKGQAEAVRLAIARALCEVNKEEYRPMLKVKGFLHRDPRVVERKKPGRPKARKRFQFSKR